MSTQPVVDPDAVQQLVEGLGRGAEKRLRRSAEKHRRRAAMTRRQLDRTAWWRGVRRATLRRRLAAHEAVVTTGSMLLADDSITVHSDTQGDFT